MHFVLVLVFYVRGYKGNREKIKTVSGNVKTRAKLVDLSINQTERVVSLSKGKLAKIK